MTITVAQLLEHVETDLSDPALQRLLDDAYSQINSHFGSTVSVTEEHPGQGRRKIWTRQMIASITSLHEGYTLAPFDLILRTVDVDFMVVDNGRAIEKFTQDFFNQVRIVFVPQQQTELRDRVAIDLCKLGVQFDGYDSQSIGDWSGDLKDYQKQRESILSALNVKRRYYA